MCNNNNATATASRNVMQIATVLLWCIRRDLRNEHFWHLYQRQIIFGLVPAAGTAGPIWGLGGDAFMCRTPQERRLGHSRTGRHAIKHKQSSPAPINYSFIYINLIYCIHFNVFVYFNYFKQSDIITAYNSSNTPPLPKKKNSFKVVKYQINKVTSLSK